MVSLAKKARRKGFIGLFLTLTTLSISSLTVAARVDAAPNTQPTNIQPLQNNTDTQANDELFQKAFAAEEAGKYSEGEAIWRKILQSEPKNYQAYLNLGNNLFWQKKTDEAITAYRKVIEINPNDVDAYHNLGAVYGSLGKYDNATPR